MDSFELTKISAAVLMALLVMVGASTFFGIMNEAGHSDGEIVGYALPKPEPEETQTADAGEAAAVEAEAAEAPAVFDPAAVVAKVADASADKGEKVFKACKACHSNSADGANKVGPKMWGVVGRDIAAVDGFRYSDVLQGKDGDWTLEKLAGFIHAPKEWAPGTKMVYRGVSNEDKLANLLAYLQTLK